MDYNKLADLLFPHITKTPEDYEKMFPERELPEGAKVTRLGPSPTGFIHLGNLYGAFVDERLAHQSGGTFYLRIEDTDDKRYVEGAVDIIIDSLRFFGINFDEGATKDGDIGIYGPYYQSQRGEIYGCFAKELVKKGMAYPCFMTSEEIEEIRAKQEANKENPGIYGKYALNRNLSVEEVEEKIASGMPYVIRLKSDGKTDVPAEEMDYFEVEDGIRGKVSMPVNNQDVIILKANGIPTYHFAHVVDDHFMRTTHVVRGEEWLPSLPIHVELFEKTGFEMPVFCHTAQLMKIDEESGQKRKLSKRKDPELSLDYYRNEGYHPAAVREYLLTILNSNYEEWRAENPAADIDEFEFTTEKMSNSGALFDLNKLNDVSKDTLVRIPASELRVFMADWSREFMPEITKYFEDDAEYIEKILDLGRTGDKPRKDLVYAKQIFEFINYFFDEYFEIQDELPENAAADAEVILKEYLASYNHADDQSEWFNKIREITEKLGYAVKPKDFKKNPDMYKGHVGDVSTVIRIALMGRSQSPDVWEIQQILGEERTRARIEKFMNK
ncbi:MAG: glutamate--tRNA ligase [Firmicutes bacterium]|nr:glutamate--tRNA ligase [Bacillota bacterium]MBQ9972766.1 glutamate--tRNA ligase [Bacillota bacterium]